MRPLSFNPRCCLLYSLPPLTSLPYTNPPSSQTFIFTGACPYNDRCVFLHDFRIKAEGVKVRTTRQTRSNSTIKDTFYWPDMTVSRAACPVCVVAVDSGCLFPIQQRP